VNYHDELPERPRDFSDGSKSSLALTYLSSAQVISGSNIFKGMLDELEVNDLRESIIKSLGYYVDLLQRKAVSKRSDDPGLQHLVERYFHRSIVDSAIFYSPSDMTPYKSIQVSEVNYIIKKLPKLNQFFRTIDVDLQESDEKINTLRSLLMSLKEDFSEDFENYRGVSVGNCLRDE